MGCIVDARTLLLVFISFIILTATGQDLVTSKNFKIKVIATGLTDPWEITYGPDKHLWVTESKTYRVTRINPSSGERSVLIDISKEKNFPRYDQIDDGTDGGKPWPQGGLMGMALHPRLLEDKPYVYLAYVNKFEGAKNKGKGCRENFGGCFYNIKVVRYQYDRKALTLSKPEIICDTIPGSNDHNAGRLLIAPVNGQEYLFYATGDMGAGQFDNANRKNRAQNILHYEGKILRFNTEPDGDKANAGKWIPNDNPFNKEKQNAVWTYGHRNPQGLAYAIIGDETKIYSSEHGPFSDDEINLIERGKNYGHPLVIGLNDGNYNGLAAGASEHTSLPPPWRTSYPLIKTEQANVESIGKDIYRDPIKSLYPTPHSSLTSILEKSRRGEQVEWISEAPSSIAVYTADAIPQWKNSLLIPTLKTGKLIRLKLDASGHSISGDTTTFFKGPMRYRDIAIANDGYKLYLSVDNSTVTSGPSEEDPQSNNCRGCIIEFTYNKE